MSILLAIVIFVCFLVLCRFIPFTAVVTLVLVALSLSGIVPPSDGFFSFAVWAFVVATIIDAVVHIARMAGFGNTNDIRITRDRV